MPWIDTTSQEQILKGIFAHNKSTEKHRSRVS